MCFLQNYQNIGLKSALWLCFKRSNRLAVIIPFFICHKNIFLRIFAMKYFRITVFLLFVTTVSAHTQNSAGFKVGYAYSAFFSNMSEHIDGRYIGVFVDMPFIRNTDFSIELNKALRGGILRDQTAWYQPYLGVPPNDVYREVDLYVQVDYIEVPLLIKHEYALKYSFVMKPYWGYSLSYPFYSNNKRDKSEVKNRKTIEWDPSDKTDIVVHSESLDHSAVHALVLGCSVEWKIFLLDIRYVHGLSDVDKVTYIQSINEKNYNLSVSFGLVLSEPEKNKKEK